MFGRKARKINELQAKLTGKDIDLRAAIKARADAQVVVGSLQAWNEEIKQAQIITNADYKLAVDKLSNMVAERDQLSAKVEELEQEVSELKDMVEAAQDAAPEKSRTVYDEPTPGT